jgi:RNA polymerase sigma factor (sigma-70 family)
MIETEKALITGCLKKDKAVWDAFVLQYSSLVYHTIKKTFALYHAGVSPEAIEDLHQEFFLSILRDDCKKLRQFKGDRGCSLASWLRLVATRLTIDFLRQQKTPSREATDFLSLDQRDLSSVRAEGERERLLLQTLQTLLPRDRLLVDLFFRQSLPTEEIASILRTSVGAVYTQKSRLLDKLREKLEKIVSL